MNIAPNSYSATRQRLTRAADEDATARPTGQRSLLKLP